MRHRVALLLLLVGSVYSQFDSSQCAQSKGCLFAPPNCLPLSNCRISFSYVVEGDSLAMELFGQLNGDGYIAAGFSNDQQMGDDTVVFCRSFNGQISNGLGHNVGKTDQELDNSRVQQTTSASDSNGNAYCSFRQRIKPDMKDVKNLDTSYYILLATGPLQNGNLSYHGSSNRFVMPRTDLRRYARDANGQVILSNAQSGDDKTPRTTEQKLLIAHGILMILSWTIFISTGILFARHFRGHWPETTLFGVKMWFNFHRTLNMIGIAATICGFVMIFVSKGWTWTGPKAYQSGEINRTWPSIHSILGLLACVVAWAQPLNAVFRCSHDQKGRFIFNWIHRFFGFGALLMAYAATMIAVVHFDVVFTNRKAAMGIYIAYIAAFGVILILMELINFRVWFSNRGKISSEIEMVRAGTSSVIIDNQNAKMRNILLLLLLIHIAIAIGAGVAISILIGLKH